MEREYTPEELQVKLREFEAAGDIERANKVRQALEMPPIDVSGAPLSQRSAVGASRGPGAQAKAAAQYGYQPFGNDNFISPEGKIFNPPGLDIGDVVAFKRPIFEAGGALVGGAGGLVAGGGPTMGLGAIPGMMAGSALGGTLAGDFADYSTPGRVDTRSSGEALKDTATDALFNSVGGPAATAYRGPAALARVAPVITGAPASIGQASEEIYRRGGTLTPGQRGNRMMQRFEGRMESSPFAGPIMDRQREQAVGIFGDIIDETTPRAVSRDTAGNRAATGFERGSEWDAAHVEDAYRTFDDIMEQHGGSDLSRISTRALHDLSNQYQDLRRRDPGFAEMVFQDPDLSRALDAADNLVENAYRNMEDPTLNLPEQATYDIIKRLRTMISKKINFGSPASEQVGLKALRDTLTADMDRGAFEIAGQAGQRAARAASDANARMMRSLEGVDPVFKYADSPTKVYQALNNALINDPPLARRAREAMGENAWDTFRDSWLRLNTRATKPGQDISGELASPQVAASSLAQLKKQSPEGYALMAEGREQGLSVIDRLGHMLRDSEKYINRSRTANASSQSLFGGDLYGGVIGGGLSLLAHNGPPSLPLIAAGAGLITRPMLSKLTAHAITSRSFNRALERVGAAHNESLPVGQDLARALIAAGADRDEVKDVFGLALTPDNTDTGSEQLY